MVLRKFGHLHRIVVAVVAGGILAGASLFGSPGVSSAAKPSSSQIGPPAASTPAPAPGPSYGTFSITWD